MIGFCCKNALSFWAVKKNCERFRFLFSFFFASGTDILPSLIKTLPVTHLIGWLARRLQPCRIKFIYLPQKTHLGRLASERNPARAEAWMTVCGIIFYFSFFFKEMSLKDSHHTSPRPLPACCCFQCQTKKEILMQIQSVCMCVRACVSGGHEKTPSHPLLLLGGGGVIADTRHAVVSSYRQSYRDSSAWPVCTELQFPTWSVRLQAKLHCDWVTRWPHSKGFSECLKISRC